jgi:hypothetical protein
MPLGRADTDLIDVLTSRERRAYTAAGGRFFEENSERMLAVLRSIPSA